jgi:N-acetylmuramoyl-L-alanine amidase
MKHAVSRPTREVAMILAVLALMVSLAPPAHADKKADARQAFEQAVRLRTMLEGYLPRDRSLADYKQTIAAYHKVYLISPQSDEVTPALIGEAELYQEMGRQFDAKYFQSAIDTYNFLLEQYPQSRYRSQAIFSIGKIQKDDLKQPEKAEVTLKEFLKRFPKSEHVSDARQALVEIAQHREPAADPLAAEKKVVPREAANRAPFVTDVRTSNTENYARIVVTIDDTIQFDSAHIRSPDRVYFDLHRAKISPALAHRTFDVRDGLLKSVRVAQNRDGVVRVVLDVDGAKDYSAFLLANPYRLVIDVHTEPVTTAAKREAEPEAPAKAKTSVPEPRDKPASKPAESASAKTDDSADSPKPGTKTAVKTASSSKPATNANKTSAALKPPALPKPNRDGGRSLTRELGLKISRIVIDPGHGGHDTGTIGPHGLMEKDLCLDIALRLGRIIDERIPGAEVIYTRKDDTFIPLEDRTAIANNAKADLFISIHANSSHDHAARGIETYYLNFATSQESMEVATRENALAQSSIHDLQDLVKKIARNEKIEESKELANDIQDSLSHRLQVISQSQKNRGVKKAPFVVLIGANMPSVLSEVSFISNPADEKALRRGDQRDRVAEGLYHGISSYLDSLNSLSYNRQRFVSDNHSGSGASGGNPK